MNLLEWIDTHLPGTTRQDSGRLRVDHKSGEVSHLWWSESPPKGDPLMDQLGVGEFDGVSLFSGTFRIAARESPRILGEIRAVPSLEELHQVALAEGARFPVGFVPFMIEPGFNLWAMDPQAVVDGEILQWSVSRQGLVGTVDSLWEVLDDWLAAVS